MTELTDKIKAKLPGSRRVIDVPEPPKQAEPTPFEAAGGWGDAGGEPVSEATAYNAGTTALGALMAARREVALNERLEQRRAEREARQAAEDEVWARYQAGAPKVGS
jgi:hypothetical protein